MSRRAGGRSMGNLWDYPESVWAYRESTWTLDRDLLGYAVRASGSVVGEVVRVENGPSGAYLVVATSEGGEPCTLIPAGLVAALDHDDRLVRVSLTDDQVRSAPRYDDGAWNDDVRARYADYYVEVFR